MKAARLAVLFLTVCSLGTFALGAEEPPLAVGSEGVPVPKKVKDLKPKYPAEAVAQGIRGIVILDLVIDSKGAVENVNVVRSVPGLDDAAVAAASQWRYEPVKVGGRPVRVRLTVPITFSLALPKLTRDAGIPDLRQGVMPVFPQGTPGGGKASVAVILTAEGRIAVKGAMQGEEPWKGALLAALDTWRFSPTPDDVVTSFRIEAEFVAGKRPEDNAVLLRATGLKVVDARTGEAGGASQAQAPPPPATAAPATAAPATAAPATAAPATAAPATASSPMAGSPVAAAPPSSPEEPAPVAAPAPPPLEVVSAPTPPPPPESGISIVRDVTLEAGVPELAKGRRPVPPPIARMAGATGSVEVAFSVSAAGTTTMQRVAGPDVLKQAAEQAVASWVFRRTRADRAYLLAVFSYGEDKATAVVRPQPAPGSAASTPAPVPAVAPAGPLPAATPAIPAPPAPASAKSDSPSVP